MAAARDSMDEPPMGLNFMPDDEERRIIIDKYSKGRDQLRPDEIDEWEDPKNTIYQCMDHYGFIHESALPEKLTIFENKQRLRDRERALKWKSMLNRLQDTKQAKGRGEKQKRQELLQKLDERVYKGIPDPMRGEAWCYLMGVEKVKNTHPGRYKEMLTLAMEHGAAKDIKQIDLDINRTFRNHQMFRLRYGTMQQKLFRILCSYCVYNSEIGYCQGMNHIAALLIMYVPDEEDAFWAFDSLMVNDKYHMHGFFTNGFPKLYRFIDHYKKVTKKFLPKVYKHLDKHGLEPMIYTLKWFFQCFLDRTPFSLSLRIWDVFMLEGDRILIPMSYTLLRLHKRKILRLNDMDTLNDFFQSELEKDFGYHDDDAITALKESIKDLRRHKMDSPREPASDSEKPSRPFGLYPLPDNLSIRTGSGAGDAASIIFRADNVSRQTSRASSEIALDQSAQNSSINKDEEESFELRRLSIYDNVDINESLEAAKRLSGGRSSSSTTATEQHQHHHHQSKINGVSKNSSSDATASGLTNGRTSGSSLRDDSRSPNSSPIRPSSHRSQSSGPSSRPHSRNNKSVSENYENSVGRTTPVQFTPVYGETERAQSPSLVYHSISNNLVETEQAPDRVPSLSSSPSSTVGRDGHIGGTSPPIEAAIEICKDSNNVQLHNKAAPERDSTINTDDDDEEHQQRASTPINECNAETVSYGSNSITAGSDAQEPQLSSPTILLVRKRSIPKLSPRFSGTNNSNQQPPLQQNQGAKVSQSPANNKVAATVKSPVRSPSDIDRPTLISKIPRKVGSSNKPTSPTGTESPPPRQIRPPTYHSLIETSTLEESQDFVSISKDAEKVRIYVPYGTQQPTPDHHRHHQRADDSNKVKLNVKLSEALDQEGNTHSALPAVDT